MSSSGDDFAAMDPGLALPKSQEVAADRTSFSEFLAPGLFGEVDPSLYQFETTASPAAALEA